MNLFSCSLFIIFMFLDIAQVVGICIDFAAILLLLSHHRTGLLALLSLKLALLMDTRSLLENGFLQCGYLVPLNFVDERPDQLSSLLITILMHNLCRLALLLE